MKWCLFMLVVCACSARQTPVSVAFNPASVRADTVDATLEIMRGDCAGEPVYSDRLAISAATTSMPLPRVRAGSYAFRVRAYNRACMLIGESCTVQSLPLDEGATLRLIVASVNSPSTRCQHSESCSEGQCFSRDSGTDGALFDAQMDASFDVTTLDASGSDATADTGSVSICGNRIVEQPEQCDDGNAVTESCTYGMRTCSVCSEHCEPVAGATRYCGDSRTQASDGETCDDGNNITEPCGYGQISCSVCSATCQTVAGAPSNCGDNQVQSSEGESCDDGNNVTEACTYGQTSCSVCAAGCHLGNGRTSYCGDGQMQASPNGEETCDDGNSATEVCAYGLTSCVVCDSTCHSVAGAISYCGDSSVQASRGEDCDDGNNATDACTYGAASCTVCSASCHNIAGAATYCGDRIVQGGNGEVCDDGNSSAGDGCVGCRPETIRQSCIYWFIYGARQSGVYLVDPDGSGAGAPFEVYCDMVTQGGGWTLVGTMGDARLFPNWDRYLGPVTAPNGSANRLHTQYHSITGAGFRVGQQVSMGAIAGDIFEINTCGRNYAGCWYGEFIDQNDGDTYGAWLTRGGAYGAVPAGCIDDACPTQGGDRDLGGATRIAIFGGDCGMSCASGVPDYRNGLSYWDYGDNVQASQIGNRAYWSNATVNPSDTSLDLNVPDRADYGQSGNAWRDIWIR